MRPLSRLAALSALLLNACYPPGDGKPPPLNEIYFPTGLALDRLSVNDRGAPRYLYIANSDFDLQYRSASAISYDLDLLSEVIPHSCNESKDCERDQSACDTADSPVPPLSEDGKPRVPTYYCVNPDDPKPCGDVGERDEANKLLYPGRCESIDPLHPIKDDSTKTLRVDSVGIGAFATDALWHRNCVDTADDGADSADCAVDSTAPSRLFVPVRGDSTLHWIDLHDGHFECGQHNGDQDGCDLTHRSGDTPDDNPDRLEQDPEPFALDAAGNGKFVVVTNQTSGSVSLYHNESPATAGPKLVSKATGLPFAPVGVAAVPKPTFADPNSADSKGWAPGFLVSYRSAAQIDLLRVRDETADTGMPATGYNRYALRRATSVPVNANSLNFDQRGIAIDDSHRQADYAACKESKDQCAGAPGACDATYAQCLRTVHQPAVYAASRAPASMLLGALTTDLNFASGTNELPSFTDSLPLSFGPSRVVVGKVRVPGTTQTDEHGRGFDLASRIFIVCFDSRRIFVYDPARQAIEAIVSTGRGPHALAVDEQRGLAYVGHFTDSYLGVISLDLRFPKTYAAIVASIGTPKTPRSSK